MLILVSCPSESALRFEHHSLSGGVNVMHSFDFDFRYYRTYSGQKLMGSGLYVFKT